MNNETYFNEIKIASNQYIHNTVCSKTMRKDALEQTVHAYCAKNIQTTKRAKYLFCVSCMMLQSPEITCLTQGILASL